MWQAGDLLRTRRNNRNLPIGDSHVRNGDRFRVLGPGPASTTGTSSGSGGGQGLIVEDLAGRGRTVLPADYLAEHCEYGWASTIDAAQGATADVGIVLVRPGMDREHLYVALTRGRLGNHAYVTPDATNDEEHDHPPHPAGAAGTNATAQGHQPTPEDRALQVLEASLATSGAQDAAHTALTTARATAVAAARQAAARQAARDAATRARESEAARTPTAEHTADLQRLRQLLQHREQLTRQHQQAAHAAAQTRGQLEGAPFWARGRRRELTAALIGYDDQRQQQPGQLSQLDSQISQVSNRLDVHDRDWNARRNVAARATLHQRAAVVPDPLGTLTRPSRPNRPPTWPPQPPQPPLDPRAGIPSRMPGTGPYQPSPSPERARGRSR